MVIETKPLVEVAQWMAPGAESTRRCASALNEYVGECATAVSATAVSNAITHSAARQSITTSPRRGGARPHEHIADADSSHLALQIRNGTRVPAGRMQFATPPEVGLRCVLSPPSLRLRGAEQPMKEHAWRNRQ